MFPSAAAYPSVSVHDVVAANTPSELVGRKHSDDDPCYIVVALDFESTERAAAFRHFLETQVWSSPTASPGLNGQPKTSILESVPSPAR